MEKGIFFNLWGPEGLFSAIMDEETVASDILWQIVNGEAVESIREEVNEGKIEALTENWIPHQQTQQGSALWPNYHMYCC